MPEGPSILILKELLLPYKGQKVISAQGNADIDFEKPEGAKILDFKSWGKHTLICFDGFYIRIHLLMFGSYRINERRENMVPRLSIALKHAELNFYTCSVKLIAHDVNEDYDWSADIMADEWDAAAALKKITLLDSQKVCDVLLNQDIFSGSGNIIKNEVLFRVAVHPESVSDSIPLKKWKELIKETRAYSFDFYTWKKEGTLKKH